MTSSCLLTINCGSSSIKFQLFSNNAELVLLAKGSIINLGSAPIFTAINTAIDKKALTKTIDPNCCHESAIPLIFQWLEQQPQLFTLCAVAHRVVHGGELFTHSVIVNKDILLQLKKLCPLAPLHQAHNLAAIDIIQAIDPNIVQIACFDTAFHANHSPLFTVCALPKTLRNQGIRRYGFHGLSFEWLAYRLRIDAPEQAIGRIIAAHLGSGASLCAMKNGVSIDTTMGLTALDGLPMGTRCGSIDPGAIFYAMRELGYSATEIETILYNDSGLLGLSGLSNNVEILQSSNDTNALFALDYFCLRTSQFIGMMAIALGGVDAIIFTGGIGENSELIRNAILDKVQCLQPFTTRVIAANEEKMMAMHTLSLLEPTEG